MTSQNLCSILSKVPKTFPDLTPMVIHDYAITAKKLEEAVSMLATVDQSVQPSPGHNGTASRINLSDSDQLDNSETTTATFSSKTHGRPWVCTSPFLNQMLFRNR